MPGRSGKATCARLLFRPRTDPVKSLFSAPKHELGWPAFWLAALASFLLWVGVFNSDTYTLVIFGTIYAALAVGIWQESHAAIVTAAIVTGLVAVMHLTRVFGDAPYRAVAYSVGFGSIAYSCWGGHRAMMREPNKLSTTPEDGDDDEPMISVVLLLRNPKYLEAEILSRVVDSVWDGDFTETDSENTANFVVGDNPLYVIKSDDSMFLVHNHSTDYWDAKDDIADSVSELRLAKAIRDHEAWLSVDFLGDTEVAEAAYAKIIRLVDALSDEDTLVVYRPQTEDIYVWTDEVATQLLEQGFEKLARANNAPVVPVSGDHPLMVKAYEQAKSQLPTLIERFKQRHEHDEDFVVKVRLTVGDTTEFIWADVIGFETKFVHGTLANAPVDLGHLKINDKIEAPLDDIYDWGYVADNEPQGFFTVAAIQAIQAENRTW